VHCSVLESIALESWMRPLVALLASEKGLMSQVFANLLYIGIGKPGQVSASASSRFVAGCNQDRRTWSTGETRG